MGDHQRLARHAAGGLEELHHLGLGVAAWVVREGVELGEAALQLEQLLRLTVVVRNHQRVVVECGRVELHAPELQHLGHQHARAQQVGVGLLEVHLGVRGAAVVGAHRPGQAEMLGHDRVGDDRVDGVRALVEGGRVRLGVELAAVLGVDVVVAGPPHAALVAAVAEPALVVGLRGGAADEGCRGGERRADARVLDQPAAGKPGVLGLLGLLVLHSAAFPANEGDSRQTSKTGMNAA
ncbi:hypothetical protein [Nonomuraea salmonea]|uniref:hypothetical protein n=1 Tax=Nonomuraea salmonea TaxID=46181 RepID=UPI0031EA8445